jgi:hypothetical protein
MTMNATAEVTNIDAARWARVNEHEAAAAASGFARVQALAKSGDELLALKESTPRGEFSRRCAEVRWSGQSGGTAAELAGGPRRARERMELALHRFAWESKRPESERAAQALIAALPASERRSTTERAAPRSQTPRAQRHREQRAAAAEPIPPRGDHVPPRGARPVIPQAAVPTPEPEPEPVRVPRAARPSGPRMNVAEALAARGAALPHAFGHASQLRREIEAAAGVESRSLSQRLPVAEAERIADIAIATIPSLAAQVDASALEQIRSGPRGPQAALDRAIAAETRRLQREFDAKQRELQAAFDAKHRQLQEEFLMHSDARARELVPEYTRRATEQQEAAENYARLISGIRPLVTKEDYRFILGLLHPDRVPEDRREKYGRAFDIFRKLERYVDALPR